MTSDAFGLGLQITGGILLSVGAAGIPLCILFAIYRKPKFGVSFEPLAMVILCVVLSFIGAVVLQTRASMMKKIAAQAENKQVE